MALTPTTPSSSLFPFAKESQNPSTHTDIQRLQEALAALSQQDNTCHYVMKRCLEMLTKNHEKRLVLQGQLNHLITSLSIPIKPSSPITIPYQPLPPIAEEPDEYSSPLSSVHNSHDFYMSSSSSSTSSTVGVDNGSIFSLELTHDLNESVIEKKYELFEDALEKSFLEASTVNECECEEAQTQELLEIKHEKKLENENDQFQMRLIKWNLRFEALNKIQWRRFYMSVLEIRDTLIALKERESPKDSTQSYSIQPKLMLNLSDSAADLAQSSIGCLEENPLAIDDEVRLFERILANIVSKIKEDVQRACENHKADEARRIDASIVLNADLEKEKTNLIIELKDRISFQTTTKFAECSGRIYEDIIRKKIHLRNAEGIIKRHSNNTILSLVSLDSAIQQMKKEIDKLKTIDELKKFKAAVELKKKEPLYDLYNNILEVMGSLNAASYRPVAAAIAKTTN